MGERIPPKDLRTSQDRHSGARTSKLDNFTTFDRLVTGPAAQHDWEGQPSFLITEEEFKDSAWFKKVDSKEKDDKS